MARQNLLLSLREGHTLTLRQQTRLTLQLSIPAILAQISSIVMQYIDASMVGQLGRDASASIGLVASSTWLFGGLCRALVVGFSVMVAQRIGACEERDARNLVKQGLCSGIAFGLLLAAIGDAISGGLPHWLHADSAICPDASAYFLIFALSLPFVQLNRLAVGVVVAAIAAFIFLGGVQRIAAVTEKVVPIMAAFYILGCIVILVINAKALPGALAQVFVLAFEPQAMAGGIAGVTVQQSMRFGVARGLFSNEAGLGSTPHAHALAKVERPQDQGAVAILGVFVDTFVVLTLTGLVLITSGLIPQGMTGTALTQAAFSQSFGGFGPIFIAVCMFFFAFSTIIGWYFFGQSNFKALFGEKLLPVYSIIVVAFILVGSTLKVDLVWALADLFNGLMAVPNLLALLALAGVVVAIDRK